jgi:hypothetical protein
MNRKQRRTSRAIERREKAVIEHLGQMSDEEFRAIDWHGAIVNMMRAGLFQKDESGDEPKYSLSSFGKRLFESGDDLFAQLCAAAEGDQESLQKFLIEHRAELDRFRD